jgi:hypothetical protein
MTRRIAAALIPLLAILCSWSCEEGPISPEGELLATTPTPGPNEPRPQEVQIRPGFLSLHMGEEAQLALTVGPTQAPFPAEEGEIVWHSTDPEVATVTADGVVIAVGWGRARIRAAGPELLAVASVWVR